MRQPNPMTMMVPLNATIVCPVPSCKLSISTLEIKQTMKDRQSCEHGATRDVRLPRFCRPRGWPSAWSKRPTGDDTAVGLASFKNASACNNFARNSSFASLSSSGQNGRFQTKENMEQTEHEIATYLKMIYRVTMEKKYLCAEQRQNQLYFQHDAVVRRRREKLEENSRSKCGDATHQTRDQSMKCRQRDRWEHRSYIRGETNELTAFMPANSLRRGITEK